MTPPVIDGVSALKGFSLRSCQTMPDPAAVLMCAPSPDHFSAFGQSLGAQHAPVDAALAVKQWTAVRLALEAAGKTVHVLDARPDAPEMVFCSTQAFAGLTPKMEKVCVIGRTRRPIRRREVPFFEAWFKTQGYAIAPSADSSVAFEGAADAVWHPGRRLVWGGYGFMSDAKVYTEISRSFQAPVIVLKLVNERFPLLETCFCPLTSEAVVVCPAAFDAVSLELILKIFPIVLTSPEGEASKNLACSSVIADSKTALVPLGAAATRRHISVMGLKTEELDASEFLKVGAGLTRLKNFVY